MRLLFITFFLSLAGAAQDGPSNRNPEQPLSFSSVAHLPDAPSAVRREQKPAGNCGPSWLGGCWDVHQPQRGYGETLKMPSFYVPFSALIVTNIIDIEATRASGCGEKRYFGRKDWGELYAEDMGTDIAVGALAYFLKRGHIKFIPEAMLSYGIFLHTRAAIRGFNANCRP